MSRRSERTAFFEGAGDDDNFNSATVGIDVANFWDPFGPEHCERWVTHFVDSGEVQPDLKEFKRIWLRLVSQRHHLGVHDARTCGEPLNVTLAESGDSPKGIGVIADSLSDIGDGLETTVRVLRKPGDDRPVVHAPSVNALKI